jgi:hypothetical protein
MLFGDAVPRREVFAFEMSVSIASVVSLVLSWYRAYCLWSGDSGDS